MSENGTAVYQRQHRRGLTMPQLSAIDLLASGKTDKETAELLNLSRTCVTEWRCYSPVFQAALNRRRAEIWGAAADRLRSLIPQALDVLAAALGSGYAPSQMKAALAILRLARFSAAQKIGPDEPEAIVRGVVDRLRGQAQDPTDDLLDASMGLPPYEKHFRQVFEELETLASQSDEAPTGKE